MKTLFDQTTLAGMTLKNRLWRSATCEKMADTKGHMTERLYSVYDKLAKGGVGLIVTGFAFVMEEEQPTAGMMGIYSDDFINEYKKLTNNVHQHDCKIVMQLVYGGCQTDYQPEKREIWGPSSVPHAFFNVTPQKMTKENIKTLTEAFTQAATRAKQAGFDGVQLHGAHGYLLSQFLTPYYNKRTDEYGGSIENRARIIYEILDAVKKAVGDDYPVMIKLHCSDYWGKDGLTPEDSLIVAQELEKRGIAAIEFSGGHFSADSKKVPAMIGLRHKKRQCYFKTETVQIADKLTIPVCLVGGNRDVDYMEEILNQSNISYFSLSRTLLSEPDLPTKWKQGFRGQPRCISCNKCFAKDVNICIFDREEPK